eukprot:9478158-Pyramimonas_sp.AAC.1
MGLPAGTRGPGYAERPEETQKGPKDRPITPHGFRRQLLLACQLRSDAESNVDGMAPYLTPALCLHGLAQRLFLAHDRQGLGGDAALGRRPRPPSRSLRGI